MEVFSKMEGKYKLQKERAKEMVKAIIPGWFYRQKMLQEMNNYRKRMENEDSYFVLGSDVAFKLFSDKSKNAKNLYDVFELYKGWDEYGHLPKKVGLLFEELLADSTHYVGIHRSDSIGQFGNVLEDQILDEVFNNGLRNMGDLFSSGINHEGYIAPRKTITPINNIFNFIMLAKTGRKPGDKASIITSIPREYVDDKYEIVNDSGSKIYCIDKGGYLNIRPEFIVGCIYQEHGNCEFYDKEDLEKVKRNRVV